MHSLSNQCLRCQLTELQDTEDADEHRRLSSDSAKAQSDLSVHGSPMA